MIKRLSKVVHKLDDGTYKYLEASGTDSNDVTLISNDNDTDQDNLPQPRPMTIWKLKEANPEVRRTSPNIMATTIGLSSCG